jgi:putative oxidoreductase
MKSRLTVAGADAPPRAGLTAVMRTVAALTLLRAVLAVAFFSHGAQKLFGWFGGLGLGGTADWFESVGLSPGRPLALLSGLVELGGGLLLGVGLLTTLAAAALVANMTVAIATINSHHGFFSTDGQNGVELPLALAAAATAVGLIGPGPLSLDRLLGLDRLVDRLPRRARRRRHG